MRCIDPVRHTHHLRYRRIGARKLMIVDAKLPAYRVADSGEILRYLPRHVTLVAGGLSLVRVIKAGHAVTGYSAEQEGIIAVLPAQPAITIQLNRQVHLVAGSTELRGFVQRLEKSLLVKLGLCLDQHPVDPCQQRLVAIGERVMDGFLDRVIRVSPGAVDMGDGMTTGAGNPRLRRGMIHVVEVRVVERTAEKRHRVVAAGAEPRPLYRTVALQRKLPRVAHRKQVHRVIEGGQMMHAHFPAAVCVCMTILAIGIHHHRLCRDKITRCRARERREKILLPRCRANHIP
ncbi:hypothetical protein MnTg04_00079 [bacterium MnTg04]|nr:hypothetical protein MnTg04_00079 [bacterium MnTg04]